MKLKKLIITLIVIAFAIVPITMLVACENSSNSGGGGSNNPPACCTSFNMQVDFNIENQPTQNGMYGLCGQTPCVCRQTIVFP